MKLRFTYIFLLFLLLLNSCSLNRAIEKELLKCPYSKYEYASDSTNYPIIELNDSKKTALKHHQCYFLIENVHIVDTKRGKIDSNRFVLLHHGVIQKVSKSKINITIGEDVDDWYGTPLVDRIDAHSRLFLTPGLAKMHTHYCGEEKNKELKHGVTTIRNILYRDENDLNSSLKKLNALEKEMYLIQKNKLIGPTILTTSLETEYLDMDTIEKVSGNSLKWVLFSNKLGVDKKGLKKMKIPLSIDKSYTNFESSLPKGSVLENFRLFPYFEKDKRFDSYWKIINLDASVLENPSDNVNTILTHFNYAKDKMCLGAHFTNDFNFYESFDLLNRWFSRAEILRMATYNAGKMCQEIYKDDIPFGYIKKGYKADLILMKNNPLELDNEMHYYTYSFSHFIFLNGNCFDYRNLGK